MRLFGRLPYRVAGEDRTENFEYNRRCNHRRQHDLAILGETVGCDQRHADRDPGLRQQRDSDPASIERAGPSQHGAEPGAEVLAEGAAQP